MGGSSYSDHAARSLYSSRVDKSAHDVFTSNSAPAATAAGIDPATFKIRESRDSDAHPESNAIAIIFDVTGSMGQIPEEFALKKLPGLMRLITEHGYIEHPQIMFGAVGDAYSDSMPLQLGQFESGLEMDDWLTKLFIEKGGGGQNTESYELAMYWASRHTAMDCLEKRSKKGYLFLMGDETYYSFVNKKQVKAVIGDDIEADIPIQKLVEEVQEKFELFFIRVPSRQYPVDARGTDSNTMRWKELLGERCLVLDDVNNVCELIGTTIGLCEGRGLDTIHADLTKAGLDPTAVKSVTNALALHASSRDLARPGTASGDLAPVAGGETGRL